VSERNVKLVLAYDGTDFSGWQIQPNHRTIQGLLQGRLREILGEPVELIGAGRTDAGVHASGQVASFRTGRNIPIEAFTKGLNSILPPEVRVLSGEEVPSGFHAQRSAVGKEYRYQIYVGEVCPPFVYRYAHHEPRELNTRAMGEGAAHLVGEHDFAAFQSTGSDVRTSVRTIHRAEIRDDQGLLELRFHGSGFLRHMVRAIAGTLLEVGRGMQPPDWVREVLEGGDRSAAGPTAPARGLFLVRVDYPPEPADGP
jgi:tRNA pseudouridine38-40 synthase